MGAFYWACLRSTEMVALLVQHGGNINAQDRDGRTSLYRACFDKKFHRVDALLRFGASPDVPTKVDVTVGW